MATKKRRGTLSCMAFAAIVAMCAAALNLQAESVQARPAQVGGNAPTQNEQSDEAAKIAATTRAKEGTMAPDFTVEMFDGSRLTLSDLRGKVVLVNFWATWCPPCREELKYVQTDIIDRFAGKEFVFIPISRGESRATVGQFRARTGYTFPMGLDSDQSIFGKYASNYIPRNFLIDRDGRVVLATVGFDKPEFAQLVKSIETTINNK